MWTVANKTELPLSTGSSTHYQRSSSFSQAKFLFWPFKFTSSKNSKLNQDLCSPVEISSTTHDTCLEVLPLSVGVVNLIRTSDPASGKSVAGYDKLAVSCLRGPSEDGPLQASEIVPNASCSEASEVECKLCSAYPTCSFSRFISHSESAEK